MKMKFFNRIKSKIMRLLYLIVPMVVSVILVTCTPHGSAIKYGLKLFLSTEGNDNWTGKPELAN